MKPILFVAPAIIAGAWLAADTVNAIVRASLPPPTPPRAIEREVLPAKRSDSPIRFAEFGEGREAASTACPASLQVLSAIVSDEWPDATIAAVRWNDVVGVVQRGDTVADSAVERVRVDESGVAEVMLRVGGDLVACRAMPRGLSTLASPAFAAGAALSAGVTCVPGAPCTIPRSLVEAIARGERTDAWSGVRVVPYSEGGQAIGFKLFGIRTGTEVAKLGLKNGDVVKSVNGIELQTPGAVFGAYGGLRA